MSTKRFLTICFVSINIVLFESSCAQKISSNGANSSTSANEISCFIFPDSSNLRLRTTISIKDAQISGITIAKLKQDTVTGMFMNEFGIKSFSFQTSEGNCKILSKPCVETSKYSLSEKIAAKFLLLLPTTSSSRSPKAIL